ncbi:hypothetical protein SOMG_01033 [Schizosaccharomyces osmophilus]|uniref:Uncharacterized protein n=1 Tax=Schizosaccharomyces osmophilus TaxID=2545709 RepID=A0AAE9WBK2_9SCHI|nr:uncharacterized protein SOMG_01033 [Schizosaccharomyces osmophilus]WBW72441.1 hypothetical protein SOMG_01033 [Schizosaccharomyces osmophilus]
MFTEYIGKDKDVEGLGFSKVQRIKWIWNPALKEGTQDESKSSEASFAYSLYAKKYHDRKREKIEV